MSTRPEILVVDDDQAVRRSMQLLLRGHGYRVRAYADSHSISNDPTAPTATLLVADYRLPSGTGFDVLKSLRSVGFAGTAVLMTGFGSEDLFRQAEAQGFDIVLDKPIRSTQLLAITKVATGHP